MRAIHNHKLIGYSIISTFKTYFDESSRSRLVETLIDWKFLSYMYACSSRFYPRLVKVAYHFLIQPNYNSASICNALQTHTKDVFKSSINANIQVQIK